MVVTLLSAAGLLEDSALGNIIIIFIQPILGVWGGKVLLVTILFLCVMKLFGEFIKKLLKLLPTPKRLLELLRQGFPKKLQDRSKPIQKQNLEKKHRLDSTNPTKEKKTKALPVTVLIAAFTNLQLICVTWIVVDWTTLGRRMDLVADSLGIGENRYPLFCPDVLNKDNNSLA